MTDQLQQLLHDEGGRLDVPPPPTSAILAAGRRRVRARRMRGAVAVAASVAVVVGGSVGLTSLHDDERGLPSNIADSPTQEVNPSGPVELSGRSVAGRSFGSDADEALGRVTARLGEPDLTVGPRQYSRAPGSDVWLEDADDPLSLSWQYPVLSVTCWQTLCLVFGGEEAGSLQLRGWELARIRRWSGYEELRGDEPDVSLAGSGIRLGDSWEGLHAAYPRTVVVGAEGASLAVRRTPWATVSDGVAGWRLSGQWDNTQPAQVPDDAVVTRLSAGAGPEPGCC